MAFSIEKLKAAFVRAWKGDEPKHRSLLRVTTEAELEQFWIPQPPTYSSNVIATLPVSSNVIVQYANGHIGSPLWSGNTVLSVSELEQIEIEVEESTESEIANMGKSKEPERKRFKTIAMAPPEQNAAAQVAAKTKDFRVFYSKDNEITGIGETDTLDNAALMVKAKYGKQAIARRRVDLGPETPHVDVVDRNATIVRQFELV